MLLFAVLAGLFLMHGISAPSMHGMPMPMPMGAQASIPVQAQAQASMPMATSTPRDDADTVSDTVPTADRMDSCETCVPLRPEGMSGLFLALFLIVITLRRLRLTHAPLLIRPHWPHGPPRTGVQTLRTLSISRT